MAQEEFGLFFLERGERLSPGRNGKSIRK